MKMTASIIFAVILLVTMFQAASWAVLEPRDDPVFGDGSITYDTATGFEWLDLTESLNKSFNDVSAQLGPGGAYEGFRHATKDEVLNLFNGNGVTIYNAVCYDSECVAACQNIAAHLGPTDEPYGGLELWGITETVVNTGRQTVLLRSYDTAEWFFCQMYALTVYPDYSLAPTLGHWLLRETDPRSIIQGIVNTVMELNINNGISNSLDAKLNSALSALDDLNENNDVAAINSLNAFINAVEAQRGKGLTVEDAENLIAQAQAIIDLLS